MTTTPTPEIKPCPPEQLAQEFHETYERLAPSFGYETRKDSAKPWSDVPEKNKKLMIAVCAEILNTRAPIIATPVTLQKAAEDAAAAIKDDAWCISNTRDDNKFAAAIILRHLAPVAREMESVKDRCDDHVNTMAEMQTELNLARKLISERPIGCECYLLAPQFVPCFGCRKKAWLARNGGAV